MISGNSERGEAEQDQGAGKWGKVRAGPTGTPPHLVPRKGAHSWLGAESGVPGQRQQRQRHQPPLWETQSLPARSAVRLTVRLESSGRWESASRPASRLSPSPGVRPAGLGVGVCVRACGAGVPPGRVERCCPSEAGAARVPGVSAAHAGPAPGPRWGADGREVPPPCGESCCVQGTPPGGRARSGCDA